MRKKHRLYLLGGILAGAVALGCQAPPQVAPGQPRVVKYDGPLKLGSDAAAAFVFERDCEEAKTGYGLQQAASPAPLDPRIRSFIVRISGPNLIKPIEIPVSLADFNGGCSFTTEFYGVPVRTRRSPS